MPVALPRSRPGAPAAVPRTLVAAVAGAALAGCGIALAWLAFGTAALDRFGLPQHASTPQLIASAIVWSSAIIAPGLCIVVGVGRLASSLGRVARIRSSRTVIDGLSRSVGPGNVVVPAVRLPDSSFIPGVVVGPHGVAVLGIAPSAKRARQTDRGWEVRIADGRWVAMEDPFERVRRDAERVRRWFAAEDRDFVVKVHTALIATEASIPRTPSCAVVTPDTIGAWLARLPIQRTLTPTRLQALAERIAGLSRAGLAERGA